LEFLEGEVFLAVARPALVVGLGQSACQVASQFAAVGASFDVSDVAVATAWAVEVLIFGPVQDAEMG